jgi:hypothetical protein
MGGWLTGTSDSKTKHTGGELESKSAPFASRAKGCGARRFQFRNLSQRLSHPQKTDSPQNRLLFYIDEKGQMVLLHGFIKKTRKTPVEDLELAKSDKIKHQRGLQ